MAHAPRFIRPAAGCAAAGLLILLLFSSARPTLAQEPEPSATEPEPVVPETVSQAPETASPSPTASLDPVVTEPPPTTEADTKTLSNTETPTVTLHTEDATATLSPSSTETATETPTATEPAAYVPSPYDPLAVIINEVAWAGTAVSSSDEWIELHNPGPASIDLDGWILTDGDDVNVRLRGSLPAYGFYLLERTDDTTIADLAADQIYAGALSNSGETLELLDPAGSTIDTANIQGGSWPAGSATNHASMERLGGADGPSAWRTHTGCWSTGSDAKGAPVRGTPRNPNSVTCPAPTASPTPTYTLTPAAEVAPMPASLRSVLINEVAWSGTNASASDEWIELHNPGPDRVDLHGWQLTDSSDLRIALKGILAPYGFYLLERTTDQTVSDVAADQVYTGGMSNGGETLLLLDPTGAVIDSANARGGAWPAGDEAGHRSMERLGGEDGPSSWATFPGYGGVGRDALGNPIAGTPRQPNAIELPKPAATDTPSRVVINEVLIRPHYDWEGAGGVSTGDEFIELYNAGDLPVRLRGWVLDDVEGAGSAPYALGDSVLPPHGYRAFFRSRTHVGLNDSGDTVRLIEPGGRVVDQITYLAVRASNLSYGRLPDGGHHLRYGLWPTPEGPNELFVPPRLPLPVVDTFRCPAGHLHPLMDHLVDHPLAVRHRDLALVVCP